MTDILALERFCPAPEDHQHYFEQNPRQRYCDPVPRARTTDGATAEVATFEHQCEAGYKARNQHCGATSPAPQRLAKCGDRPGTLGGRRVRVMQHRG